VFLNTSARIKKTEIKNRVIREIRAKKLSTVKPNCVTKTLTAVPCVYQQNITSKNNKKILLKRAQFSDPETHAQKPKQKTV